MNALAASKPARELYIGGIPMGISALQLQNVCSTLLQQLGGCTSPGNPVVTGWIASDGVFGFVEFRSGALLVCCGFDFTKARDCRHRCVVCSQLRSVTTRWCC
jgi:hypothetical protein